MHALAELLHAIAWPAIALVAIIVFRPALTHLLRTLAARLEHAQKISLGPGGLKLEGAVAQLRTQLAAIEIKTDLPTSPAPRAAAAPAAIPPELIALADAYLAERTPNYAARVAKKTRLAAEAAALAAATGVPRALLADATNEGLLITLATLIIAAPEPGDGALWLRAAPKISRKHVAYRMAIAATELRHRHLLSDGEAAQARAILEAYRSFADPSLGAMLDTALTALAAPQA